MEWEVNACVHAFVFNCKAPLRSSGGFAWQQLFLLVGWGVVERSKLLNFINFCRLRRSYLTL